MITGPQIIRTDLPPLYVEGSILPRDSKAVAIVGSRIPTKYGLKVAYDFAFFLAQNGVTIISGLARGIDTAAHNGALDGNGRTIAVFGSGLDIIYPYENKDLSEKITKFGALVSPFVYGTKPLGVNFLGRNKIIAMLSKVVLIVEGAKRSGTLSTAASAANLGIEVFAIPGPVDSETSYAPNYLIQNGARVAQSPRDILDYINEIEG